MTIRRQRLLLNLGTLALAIASIWMIVTAFISIPEIFMPHASVNGDVKSDPHTVLASEPSLEQLLTVASVPLRRPLIDPPPAAPPPLRIKLSGTILEPGFNRAIIVAGDGRSAMHSVGDVVDQAEVVSIDKDRINVRLRGEVITLKAEASAP